MTARSTVKAILFTVWGLSALLVVSRVGEPRKPYSPADAVGGVLTAAALIFMVAEWL